MTIIPQQKIGRDAFLYMHLPEGVQKEVFAQCASCQNFVAAEFRVNGQSACKLFGGGVEVDEDDSCGLYTMWPDKGIPDQETMTNHGKKLDAGLKQSVSPEEAGFVDRAVRCENCFYFDVEASKCALFSELNLAHRDFFNLDENVEAGGCCNAQTPKDFVNRSLGRSLYGDQYG
jgi:hypothetical protein